MELPLAALLLRTDVANGSQEGGFGDAGDLEDADGGGTEVQTREVPGLDDGRLTGRSVRGRNCCHYNGIEGRLLMLSTHLLRLFPGNQPNLQIASIGPLRNSAAGQRKNDLTVTIIPPLHIKRFPDLDSGWRTLY